jgi:hypothetical protein
LQDAWLQLIGLSLAERRWAEAARQMSAAETASGLTSDLAAEPFVGFVASKEGAEWTRAHRQPTPKKTAP